MADKQEIIAAVDTNLAHMRTYSDWTIGICGDPRRAESRLDYPPFFRTWEVDSYADAVEVRSHFVDLGMQEGDKGSSSDSFVYLY